jgi:hypothetical protein
MSPIVVFEFYKDTIFHLVNICLIMNRLYPIQHRLFKCIEERLPQKSNWLQQYMKRFGLSSSPAYSRLRGEKSISFDEGITLLLENNLTLRDILPKNDKAAKEAVQFIVTASPETAVRDYLTFMYSDLKHLARIPNGFTYHQTNDLPVFWLKQSRGLAAFKLYHWFHHYGEENEIKSNNTIPFGYRWMEIPEISKLLDESKGVLQQYRSVPGVEFWSAEMFDKIIYQIMYVQSLGLFEEKDRASTLINGLYGLIDHLEQVVIKKNKNPDNLDQGAHIDVYDNRIFDGNYLIMGVSDTFNFFYSDFGTSYMRTDQKDIAIHRATQLKSMLPHSVHISGSELARRNFFNLLRETVSTKLNRLTF